MKKAILLDRDGTINKDPGYISNSNDFHLYPYAAQAIKRFNEMGFLVFIITNQSGISRGFLTLENLEEIHNKMLSDLKKKGAEIDEIYFSPHHRDGIIEPYNVLHEDRKPGLGLFKKIKKKYQIISKQSFMIGDKHSDIEFGAKAGLKTILVLSGYGEIEFYEKRNNWLYKPDYITLNLLSAAKLVEYLEK